MKTLTDHTLIYDKDCPMCVGYTSAFIKTGMLDNNGREAFSEMSSQTQAVLSIEKAADEIALVDRTTGNVLYGIDSMLKVIGNAIPLVAIVGHWRPINFLLKKIYKFISYNRKVIIPNMPRPNNTLQCVPTFNYTYRWLFIIVATIFTGLILNSYGNVLAAFLPTAGLSRELSIASGQIAFQALILQSFSRKTIVNYLGNMTTISLGGSLLLSVYLLFNSFISLTPFIGLLWFGIVFTLMLIEHIRRVKLLGLPSLLTISWVLYRCLVLILIYFDSYH
ncbi:DCC1-like thiol-disulfide oxidoreductase family protein [Sungkyunkwania multivorans]|uniref:DCC1-like thiol-disulfide oxidoreductase family protein n=1 Tax=Sungkyunkwania multivorans TaxID=1173618 RepID=A0ABW3D0X2_9FLAO